ncbi:MULTISPECIES: TadE/TadG family type IV pilus assembly protein [unclassified Leisingera]|uniref:TadE/TadG family type IV pilus assembly protein n=1 Tax=unclassified Leisingera TaxID=2614906 RepID=UPI001FFD0ED0|nr:MULTISPECIES: TadE/TadG family type IV pilus assembly protein [unclassified Leisingera]
MQRCLAKAKAFLKEEDGVMAAPTCFTVLAMVAIGGIGIDLMRMERDRTNLQYTLDRAVLAAADLDQTLAADAVVLDYLTKVGLEQYYSNPIDSESLGYKSVEATINTDFDALWLNFSGVSSLPIYANSRAEESIDGVEISMVLDVSGSMTRNSRLTNLKVAAKDFVDTMVANTTDGKMSISIVPYATQVSAPEELLDQYNLDRLHTYSNCVNFSASDFNSAGLSTSASLEQTMQFSPWDRWDDRPGLVGSPVCEEHAHREMMLLQKDATALKGFIDGLVGRGNTSIDIGMKWGTALLDPSARPAISALSSGAGAIIPSDFSARPSAYTDTDTVKVIVLMTDGQNTSQYYVENDHREGDSNVWYDAASGVYSTLNPSTGKFRRDGYSYWHNTPKGGDNAERLTNVDLFAKTPLKYLYYNLFGDWMGISAARSEWYYGVYDYHGNSTKNARTRSICQAAKDQGIIVYTIGFEAPSDGVAVLQDCASSDAHYFDVDGLEISDAFASIATSIRQLRLTQ